MFDQNKDGIVGRDDLGNLLASLGKPSTDIDGMFRDIPSDGELNFTLFLALLGDYLKEIDEEEYLLSAFQVLDSNNCGSISYSQLQEQLTTGENCMTAKEFEQIFSGIDLNSQGRIEYKKAIKAILPL